MGLPKGEGKARGESGSGEGKGVKFHREKLGRHSDRIGKHRKFKPEKES